jgi:hypothetical protein
MGASCSSDARTSTARSRARNTAKARRGTITSFDDPPTFNRKPRSTSVVLRRASRAQDPPGSNKEHHVTPCRSSQVHNEHAVVENRATVDDCTADTRGALFSNTATNPLVLPVVTESVAAVCVAYDVAGHNVGAGEAVTLLAPPTSEGAPYPLHALEPSTGPLYNCDLVPRDGSSPLISTAAATRRRLSIMAPSAADSELQQASTYSSLTSPLANLIRVHDCFSSSQHPSKGSDASAALTSLTHDVRDVRDANASPSRLVQPTHIPQLPSPRRSSPVSFPEQLPPIAPMETHPTVPDASALQSVTSQVQQVLMFDVPEVLSAVDVLPANLRPSNPMPSPLKEGVVASRRGNTDARGTVSPQRGGAGMLLRGGPRRSVVASLSPSQFSPLRKSLSGSESTIV